MKTILVVEDNVLNAKLLDRFLTAKGYRVIAAATCAEAEGCVAAAELVLLDVSLPGEDGLSWLRRMRAEGRVALPVIAVTAHAMARDREEALAAGCAGWIPKPVELAALLELVRSHA